MWYISYTHRNRALPRPPGPPPLATTEEQYQVPNITNGYLVPICSHQYNYIEPQKQDGSLSPSGDDLNEFSDHEDDNIPYQCKHCLYHQIIRIKYVCGC